MSTDQRRQHQRYFVEVAAELSIGSKMLAAATQNVSEGGVGLLLEEELDEGAEIGLTLFLTQDGIEDPDEDPFEARATVAWTAAQEGGVHVAGVRFANISPAQRTQLTRFLSAVAR